jgi:hypothetical protein
MSQGKEKAKVTNSLKREAYGMKRKELNYNRMWKDRMVRINNNVNLFI